MSRRCRNLVIYLLATMALGPGCGRDETKPGPVPPAGPELVTVPSGAFTQGSPESEPRRRSDEAARSVTLTRSLLVGRREVTQAEWQLVMGWLDSGFRGSDRPVERVTWFDCLKFCNALSTREGLRPAYALDEERYNGAHLLGARVAWDEGADGYRLPTEAEWEYACRATTLTAFSNGAFTAAEDPHAQFPECMPDPSLDAVGWYCANSGGMTEPVGGKAGNAWGLLDMHGNVQEWCWDWYEPYPAGAVTDPVGPATGIRRCVRGGSWSSLASTCRSACRSREIPSGGSHAIGLRLVRTAQAGR